MSEAATPPWRRWRRPSPHKLMGRGHPAGDFLEAYEWTLVEETRGGLRLDVHLPKHCKNPRGQLFGGFTPTYVDLVALHTVWAGMTPDDDVQPRWMATTNMRVDYFEPITGPRFSIESRIVRDRGRMVMVETRFFVDIDGVESLAVFALTTMRKVPLTSQLGDA